MISVSSFGWFGMEAVCSLTSKKLITWYSPLTIGCWLMNVGPNLVVQPTQPPQTNGYNSPLLCSVFSFH
ncbi:unnamed protein product [Linum tenue]|uniref:Uncharacterized protein n=1 Tax=Linum tenue TaxID=586396 RepID=A0AAV0MEB3_9ROSI|nr:unnamed protein product [Linum tenue]